MIHLTLRQLEYFAAAARHGGAARAAAMLNVSQPSISKAIAELESLWGERLFVRLHARGLELTPAGRARYRQANTLLQQARQMAGPRPRRLEGLLRVGCLSTFGPRYLPGILARMQNEAPGIEVRVEEGDTELLIRSIERGSLDVAMLYDLGLSRRVRLTQVASLWPYALLPWGHALAKHATVSLADLAREPVILINLPHSREYFLSLFRAVGAAPRIAHETASLEMLRSMVANGLGVSLLTTRPVRDTSYDGKRIACRRLRAPPLPQSVVLAYPPESDDQPDLAATFARSVQAFFTQSGDELTRRSRHAR